MKNLIGTNRLSEVVCCCYYKIVVGQIWHSIRSVGFVFCLMGIVQ